MEVVSMVIGGAVVYAYAGAVVGKLSISKGESKTMAAWRAFTWPLTGWTILSA